MSDVIEVLPEEQEILTAAEGAVADKLWNEKIKFFKGARLALGKNFLLTHWAEGGFLAELVGNAKKYGGKTVENYAIAMSIDTSSAYQILHFRQTYKTQDEVTKLADSGVSWRAIVTTLSLPSDETRKELLQQLQDGEIKNVEDLSNIVKDLNRTEKQERVERGEKVDKRGGGNATTTIKSMISLCTDLGGKLGEFKNVYKEFTKMPEGNEKSNMHVKFRDGVNTLDGLVKSIQGVFKLIGPVCANPEPPPKEDDDDDDEPKAKRRE